MKNAEVTERHRALALEIWDRLSSGHPHQEKLDEAAQKLANLEARAEARGRLEQHKWECPICRALPCSRCMELERTLKELGE